MDLTCTARGRPRTRKRTSDKGLPKFCVSTCVLENFQLMMRLAWKMEMYPAPNKNPAAAGAAQ